MQMKKLCPRANCTLVTTKLYSLSYVRSFWKSDQLAVQKSTVQSSVNQNGHREMGFHHGPLGLPAEIRAVQ